MVRRWGSTEGYRFDVLQGRYGLELLFTDTHQKQAQSIYLLGKTTVPL